MTANGRHNADTLLVSNLAVGHTYAAAAEAAGVSERTARRRMNDPIFRFQVEEARAEMLTRAVELASEAAVDAVGTLTRLMQSGRSEPVQLRAATTVLEFVGSRSGDRMSDFVRTATMVPAAAFQEFARRVAEVALPYVPEDRIDSFLDDVEEACKTLR